MGGKHKIKKPIIREPVVGNVPEKIVFGFSELRQYSYTEAANDGKFFIKFLERMKKLGELTWDTVFTTQRHSFGAEKIPVSSLRSNVRKLVPSGMDSLLALRATGDNHVFLGYRDGDIFQVLFIEHEFGDVYDH